jgi:hydroxymethylpyrimidine pyrophosphatase-like HAD family hydrolase
MLNSCIEPHLLGEIDIKQHSPKQRFVIASDFDGTLKEKGKPVSKVVLDYLCMLKKKGIGLILVTGRCLKELSSLIDTSMFDAIVVENGAIVISYGNVVNLAPANWSDVRKELVAKYGTGCEEVIISLPRETVVDIKLIQKDTVSIEYNKDRVMILPKGVSKGSGLSSALKILGWEGRKLICAGDGENDLSMLLQADYKIAVKNSVEQLKGIANFVAEEENGDGFVNALRYFFDEVFSGSRILSV